MYKSLNSTIFTNSTILTNEKSLELCNLINISTNKSWGLLYQASRDGFKANDFHSKADGVQGTLTLIKTVDNFVFGGYTEADWGSNGYTYDENAFIFSLINDYNTTAKMNVKPNNYAIYASSFLGPAFGKGDIMVTDKSNISTESFSQIFSFEFSSFSGFYLTRVFYFKTLDIEVYSVIIDR